MFNNSIDEFSLRIKLAPNLLLTADCIEPTSVQSFDWNQHSLSKERQLCLEIGNVPTGAQGWRLHEILTDGGKPSSTGDQPILHLNAMT
ncbi:hypothetical protein DPMN_149897 [Dreissena polymorpha]|uniref:Uncharacterized protein n=1 Tax=Dreissena polymorpha TaxID=45954 RepID=A0A9D4FCF9_DREPO|nr:hypothetical protein DPMN_149897 [Dreissena polymorpha]